MSPSEITIRNTHELQQFNETLHLSNGSVEPLVFEHYKCNEVDAKKNMMEISIYGGAASG